ncbi:MAG: YidC/Oxa1 family insertase periplasmic-domain containing protein, partial [Candidatus Omnitrophica bacterium]|nr:YidC/Oxa1 family insertase periplasmic-domain containing protein [Candidatus Omnitrophota bacterium]
GKFTIPPNYLVEHKYLLYAGPGKASTLKAVGQGFEETINYGVFGFISKILLSLMGFINGVVRNWGVSIILLSIILNIALFPLSVRSFKSMKKMQELHPQMEKLKTQYKDNPQKLNKEIMELYKKYHINPFSGCLPLILQMPIFIALYNAIIRYIDLKNAGFLWIKDLSLPDAVKIPISLPLIGNSINILPIFMIIAMVIQQKISTKSMGGAVTAEQKQQQQMMLILMPIMFGFIFYNMPSGLVLYWVVNTILTIVEQSAIAKNI